MSFAKLTEFPKAITAYDLVLILSPDSFYGDLSQSCNKIRPLSNSDIQSLTFVTERVFCHQKIQAAIVLSDKTLSPKLQDFTAATILYVADAKKAIAQVIRTFIVSSRPLSYIHPSVQIYPCVSLGLRCLIHAGTIIGGPGLGIIDQEPFPDIGGVVIGNDVQIGANCAIARSPIGNTIIQDKVKIGNLVNIGHNAYIEEAAIITSGVIVGRGRIGKKAYLGLGAIVLPGVEVGDGAMIGAGSVVTKNIAARSIAYGNPARER